jgi:hypothetical protein
MRRQQQHFAGSQGFGFDTRERDSSAPSVVIVLVAREAVNKKIGLSGGGALYHGGFDEVDSDVDGNNLA